MRTSASAMLFAVLAGCGSDDGNGVPVTPMCHIALTGQFDSTIEACGGTEATYSSRDRQTILGFAAFGGLSIMFTMPGEPLTRTYAGGDPFIFCNLKVSSPDGRWEAWYTQNDHLGSCSVTLTNLVVTKPGDPLTYYQARGTITADLVQVLPRLMPTSIEHLEMSFVTATPP